MNRTPWGVSIAVRRGNCSHLLGDVAPLPEPGTTFELHYVLTDGDEPDARYDIDVLANVVGSEEVAQLVERVRHTGNTAERDRDVIEGGQLRGGFERPVEPVRA